MYINTYDNVVLSLRHRLRTNGVFCVDGMALYSNMQYQAHGPWHAPSIFENWEAVAIFIRACIFAAGSWYPNISWVRDSTDELKRVWEKMPLSESEYVSSNSSGFDRRGCSSLARHDNPDVVGNPAQQRPFAPTAA